MTSHVNQTDGRGFRPLHPIMSCAKRVAINAVNNSFVLYGVDYCNSMLALRWITVRHQCSCQANVWLLGSTMISRRCYATDCTDSRLNSSDLLKYLAVHGMTPQSSFLCPRPILSIISDQWQIEIRMFQE